MSLDQKKSLGRIIDEVVSVLGQLDRSAQPAAIRAICQHLGIRVVRRSPAVQPDVQPAVQPAAPAAVQPAETPTPESAVYEDIGALKNEKKPGSTQEMACLVAHYLASLAPEDERKSELGVADMKKYFKRAKYRMPKDMAKTLAAAKRSGYLEPVTRSKYRLAPAGRDLVDRMPTKK